jgi:hypothetical protein
MNHYCWPSWIDSLSSVPVLDLSHPSLSFRKIMLNVIGFFGTLELSSVRAADVVYTPIQPPSYPLAVRNPYLSTWIPGGSVAELPSSTPQFWTGAELGWGVIGRVNGKTYNLLGIPDPENGTLQATVLSAEYTSTHSIFILNAASTNFTLDFFSPVSPDNYLRQSLPFSIVAPRSPFERDSG